MTPQRAERVFTGNGVSAGVAIGQAMRLDSQNRVVLRKRIAEEAVEPEIQRLRQAMQSSKEQLESLKRSLEAKVGVEHSFILDIHLLMLEDRHLVSQIEAIIRKAHSNAEWAVQQATDRIRRAYAALEDEYFRERGHDVEYVVERILTNLTGDHPITWAELPPDLVIASHSFNPSAYATVDLSRLRGLALESGGRTSHTAIIARSLHIPAVMGIADLCAFISSGDVLLIDGEEGLVVQNPSPERLESIQKHQHKSVSVENGQPEDSAIAAVARDGTRISLLANIDVPNEALAAKKCGAEGIGLFRSEFLFYGHPHKFPTVEEQRCIYQELIEQMRPNRVAVRTLDAGGDKALPGVKIAPQPNPSMGLRGIRLSLQSSEQFCSQIEAIIKAGCPGSIEVVLPMVSSIEEVREAKALIRDIEKRVAGVNGTRCSPIPIGAMIEVPAAVLALESIASETDFLCVGTNDLIQYMLAVDRTNPQVAYLFQPLHPSVLQCLKRIADVAVRLGKPARICGEMSANPLFAVLLIGMGYAQLSMNCLSIPLIRKIIQQVSVDACRQIADRVLTFITAAEITDYLIESVQALVQTDISPYAREVRTPAGRSVLSSMSRMT